ncbi:HPr kinase/phosphatase C-terminal domain-containing protein [Pseudooceanicola sp. CBS1P-1]|uniref:Serine kinase n=1 Tax=Pseudooceanicola albus TaxID=2692189 RepID=A0A6L7G2S4_9RHOB|nr:MULTISPECIES: HPr kinase/phosphatase C-terminal domain-containing protein [Pseudooceanicola]MBT9384714.1 HPr kinase/phosphatase C-terminal domain-containing protein [Pseudooceanicola endophyticus]MXN18415.1 serine kinase [Pseudooceanicola albus]
MGQGSIHATCVSLEGRGLLIRGPSGSGKSSLALELMARGAGLVSDDRVILERRGAAVIASAPETIRGMIEARGVGLLNARPADPAPLVLVVDLATPESDRLPPHRSTILLGVSLTLLHNTGTSAFPAAILQYLREGRAR